MHRSLAPLWPRLRALLPAAVLAAGPACSAGEGPRVAFLGDSLTEGWRLRRDEAYPALLARELAARGRPIRVHNAGRSGDTVAQARARLPGVLRRQPDVLVVALGVNDALRKVPVEEAEGGLRAIVKDARDAGARVLLVGCRAPAALATEHTRRLEAVYARVASEERVPLVPDLLAGAAGRVDRMFPDALHPNAAGQRQLAANVRPALELVLAEVAAAREGGSAGR